MSCDYIPCVYFQCLWKDASWDCIPFFSFQCLGMYTSCDYISHFYLSAKERMCVLTSLLTSTFGDLWLNSSSTFIAFGRICLGTGFHTSPFSALGMIHLVSIYLTTTFSELGRLCLPTSFVTSTCSVLRRMHLVTAFFTSTVSAKEGYVLCLHKCTFYFQYIRKDQ